jgi:hypothetical protein
MGYAAGLLTCAGNAVWITMDRRRRGLEVGSWRFATIFLGPAVLVVYIVKEYREWTLFIVPAVVSVYLLDFVVVPVAVNVILKVWS